MIRLIAPLALALTAFASPSLAQTVTAASEQAVSGPAAGYEVPAQAINASFSPGSPAVLQTGSQVISLAMPAPVAAEARTVISFPPEPEPASSDAWALATIYAVTDEAGMGALIAPEEPYEELLGGPLADDRRIGPGDYILPPVSEAGALN